MWPVLVYQPPAPPAGHYEAMAADVGQGSAVMVRTATHALVFDTGPPMGAHADSAQRVLLPWLRALGVRPAMLVASHDDSDHVGGLRTLAAAFPEADIRASFDASDRVTHSVTRCRAGERWVWDGVPFEFLHPFSGDEDLGWPDNAMSCVLRVGEGNAVTLLTGDLPMAQETRLAMERPELRASWLVAGHHGSKTSSGPLWLDALQPRWVIVQAGYRSRYGHPSPQVLSRLEARGIPWVNIANCGAAHWRSWQPSAPVCHRYVQRRYWTDLPANQAVGDEGTGDSQDRYSLASTR
jgi:competence protein ComEC